jgi:lysophospholipase L1-like esterase
VSQPARGSADYWCSTAPKSTSRLQWLLGVAGLAVVVGLAIRYFWFSQPQGEGPAGPAVQREMFAASWTERPVLLVGLGDSVTAGFGARRGYSYFDRLAANPAEEWPEMKRICLGAVIPHLQATNLAISGSTSLGHVARQLPLLPQADTNTLGVIVLTTGGNDLIHDYGRTAPKEGAMFGASWEQAQPWITNYAARLEFILNTITNAYPGGCHVFLANIYDPTDGTGDARRVGLPPWPDAMRIHAAYNDVIGSVAARRPNVHLVDLHAHFLGHGLFCTQFWGEHYRSDDPYYWYFVNLEDPNERGYDAIRRLFLNEMVRVRDQLN